MYKIAKNLEFMQMLANFLERVIGTFLIGKTRIAPNTLNKTWDVATTAPAVEPEAIAARTAVKVVPMFAPIIYGKMLSRETIPVPARGTIKEVVIEELWTTTVKRSPNEKDLKGLEKMCSWILCLNSDSAIGFIVLTKKLREK